MKKIIALLLAVITVATVFCSCGSDIEKGKIDGDKYTNSINSEVGITFNLPDGWKYEDNRDDEDEFRAVDSRGVDRIEMTVQNLGIGGLLYDLEEYIDEIKAQLKKSYTQNKYTFETNTEITLSGIKFIKVSAKASYEHTDVMQYIYFYKDGTDVLMITATTTPGGTTDSEFEAMFS